MREQPDARGRPIVLDTGPAGAGARRRGSRTLLATAVATLIAAAALAAGGWSILTAIEGGSSGPMTPLWYPTPAAVTPPPGP